MYLALFHSPPHRLLGSEMGKEKERVKRMAEEKEMWMSCEGDCERECSLPISFHDCCEV